MQKTGSHQFLYYVQSSSVREFYPSKTLTHRLWGLTLETSPGGNEVMYRSLVIVPRPSVVITIQQNKNSSILLRNFMMAIVIAHTLATFELLELVLSNLPPRDILLFQRVCRTWHALSSTSPILQTLLYFRAPSTATSESYILNPLLKDAFPFMFQSTSALSDQQRRDYEMIWPDTKDAPSMSLGPRIEHPYNAFTYSLWDHRPEAWCRKEAS